MTGIESQLPALQVVVPLLSAPLLLLLRGPALAWAGATATSLLSLAMAISLTSNVLSIGPLAYSMGGWPAPFGIELRIDAFSALLLLVVSGASSAALLAGRASLDWDLELHRQPLFYAAWMLALSGFLGIVVSADAFNIFVFMEISSLASYILIAGGTDRRALPAVFKYLIMGTVGATFYLIGIGLIYLMTGTLNLADMEARILNVEDQRPILVAAGFITIGLALKAAVFPLHAWLPNAYTYAPNMVSVFLAACATKVSLYVLFRVDFLVFQPNLVGHGVQFAYFLLPLGILAALVASGLAIVQSDLKRLLAYSSIAQIGYILMGASLGGQTGLTAAIIHMFNHALAKGALFLAVAGLALRLGSHAISRLNGAAGRMPLTMGAFVVAALSLIGVPGTAGFISKWYLILAALEQGAAGVGLVVVIALSSLMAVIYVWRIIEAAYFQPDAHPAGSVAAGEAPLPLLAVTILAAAANLYFGIVPEVPLGLAQTAAGVLLGGTP